MCSWFSPNRSFFSLITSHRSSFFACPIHIFIRSKRGHAANYYTTVAINIYHTKLEESMLRTQCRSYVLNLLNISSINITCLITARYWILMVSQVMNLYLAIVEMKWIRSKLVQSDMMAFLSYNTYVAFGFKHQAMQSTLRFTQDALTVYVRT